MNIQRALDHATLEGLFAIAEGDESFVRDLLVTYVAQAGQQLDAIHVAMAKNDTFAAARAAHALAGASLNVGALEVARICRRIEAASVPAVSDVRDLERELSRVCDEPLAQM